MDFPIAEFLDEDACYQKIVALLHPYGLACPRCDARDGLRVHRRTRDPVLDYRCTTCGRVFNALHRDRLPQDPPPPLGDPPDPPGHRPRHDHGAAGP